MNTYTPTQTARPSRARIMGAMLDAWIERNRRAVALVTVSLIVLIMGGLLTASLMLDFGMSFGDALAIFATVLALCFVSSFVTHFVSDERASERTGNTYRRIIARNERERVTELARVIADYETRLALSKRAESRNAYALLTALEESDNY